MFSCDLVLFCLSCVPHVPRGFRRFARSQQFKLFADVGAGEGTRLDLEGWTPGFTHIASVLLMIDCCGLLYSYGFF